MIGSMKVWQFLCAFGIQIKIVSPPEPINNHFPEIVEKLVILSPFYPEKTLDNFMVIRQVFKQKT